MMNVNSTPAPLPPLQLPPQQHEQKRPRGSSRRHSADATTTARGIKRKHAQLEPHVREALCRSVDAYEDIENFMDIHNLRDRKEAVVNAVRYYKRTGQMLPQQ